MQLNELKVDSKWSVLDGGDWIIAEIVKIDRDSGFVYFTMKHRPRETLNCTIESFLTRYLPHFEKKEYSGSASHSTPRGLLVR